jgi:DNA modification methylase
MKIAIESIYVSEPSDNIDQERLQSIADSLTEIGLSQPIIVHQMNTSGQYAIISGEKRLLAAQLLSWTEIECEIREASELDAKTIRLHENLKRFNLTWQEEVTLRQQLHELRQAEHGPALTGRPKNTDEDDEPKKGWSIRDTARELGTSLGGLSQDLSLARALEQDPTLYKVQDKRTAIRLSRVILQRHTSEQEAGLRKDIETDQIYCADSAIVLAQLPANSINHCITDPPWINFFEPHLTLDDRTLPVFKELYRVLKHGSFLYLFCGLDDYAYYAGIDLPDKDNPSNRIHTKGELEKIGFNVAKTPIIWKKEAALSRRGVKSWEYDRDFEFIIVAAKGSPALVTSRRLSGIKSFKIVHNAHSIHQNEKPIELIEDIITDCSYEGEVIIDPFGGSGVLGAACMKNNRKFILIERNKEYYDNICARLEIER